jgi:hypothetical protein
MKILASTVRKASINLSSFFRRFCFDVRPPLRGGDGFI